MNDIFRFFVSFQGRITRILAGIIFAFWGIFTGNVFLLVIGIVPLAAGVFDKCVFAPLFKHPFDGPALRRTLNSTTTPQENKVQEKNSEQVPQNQDNQPKV